MGMITLVAVCVYAGVAGVLIVAAVLSAARCRAVPLFWILALICAVVGPFALSAPLPVKHGGDFGAVIGYLFDIAFTRFNLLCFVGAVVSAGVALLPVGLLRIVSAASWGFASSFAVHSFLLFSS